MKTAISIPDMLFDEIETLSKEYKCSRSRFVVIALRDYIENIKSKKLLSDINSAYSASETKDDTDRLKESKKYYKRAFLKERY